MRRHKKKLWFLLLLLVSGIVLALPEVFYKNEGSSRSVGSVRNGSLEEAYLLPYSGKNFRYFSPFSYYILNNGYTHSKVYHTLMEAYRQCEKSCPATFFRVMECSDRYGGKMLIHRTHQNGMSVDFMVPKITRSGQSRFFDRLGLLHYLLDFDDSGHLEISKNVRIDFEAIGKHILALDNAAEQNGLRIRKVILKIELKDDLYATQSGTEIKKRGIYIVQALTKVVNQVHDDHYHIDFEPLH